MVSPCIIAMYMSLSMVGVTCSSLTWPMWRQTALNCQRCRTCVVGATSLFASRAAM
jgi:hypothetical protein